MCRYQTFAETIVDPEYGEYTTYGVIANDNGQQIVLRNVESCRPKIERFVRLLNERDVACVHLEDLVSDFFGSNELQRFYPELA